MCNVILMKGLLERVVKLERREQTSGFRLGWGKR